jgi:type II secretion system protein I
MTNHRVGNPSSIRKSQGFTLIETLIAIVMVAAVLPIALMAVSHVTSTVSRLHKQAIAVRLADTKMAQWLADASWQSAPASGDFSPDTDGEDSQGFHWQLQLSPWRDASVTTLHLTVSWETESLQLDTLVVAKVTP